VLEIDALQGDDTIDVLSTPANMIVRVLGGLGSDTINVAGDVVGDVVAKDVNGSSATINTLVTSSDPAYNNIVAPGINVDVARPTQGNVIVTETGGGTAVSRGGACGLLLVGCTMDSYTVALASQPTSDVWITVSAEMSPQGLTGGDTAYLCSGTQATCSTDAAYFRTVLLDGSSTSLPNRSLVLHFTPQNYATPQTVWVAAANDTAAQGDIVIAISQSAVSADTRYSINDPIRNVEVTIHDNIAPGVAITQLDSSGNPDGNTTVIKGTTTTQLTDTFTIAPPSLPNGSVT
jgi:hypothetical protein